MAGPCSRRWRFKPRGQEASCWGRSTESIDRRPTVGEQFLNAPGGSHGRRRPVSPALGLTPGIALFADELRRAGRTVHTPDLFEGRTFPTLEDGMRHAEAIGFPEVIERGVHVVAQLPTNVVYAGFSLDPTLPSYDAGAAAQVIQRSLALLRSVEEFSGAPPGFRRCGLGVSTDRGIGYQLTHPTIVGSWEVLGSGRLKAFPGRGPGNAGEMENE